MLRTLERVPAGGLARINIAALLRDRAAAEREVPEGLAQRQPAMPDALRRAFGCPGAASLALSGAPSYSPSRRCRLCANAPIYIYIYVYIYSETAVEDAILPLSLCKYRYVYVYIYLNGAVHVWTYFYICICMYVCMYVYRKKDVER